MEIKNGYKDRFEKWLEDDFFDDDIRKELRKINDEKAIENRFYHNLGFGTGTNRMNKYIIGRATKAHGAYLLDSYGIEVCTKRGVVIGYDFRNNSKRFSRVTADVFTGMGLKCIYILKQDRSRS